MNNHIHKSLMIFVMLTLIIGISPGQILAQVRVTPPAPPDLAVPAARIGFSPAAPRDGEEVTFDISVRNLGGPVRDARLYCELRADGRRVASKEYNFDINAHSPHPLRWRVRMPAGRNVRLYVIAKARGDADESNNRAVVNVTEGDNSGESEPPRESVTPPESNFRILDIGLKADAYENQGACPQTVGFGGWIKVDGPGTITYTFTRSDGAKAPVQTLIFDRAGTKNVRTTWMLGRNYEGWQAIMILSPTVVESNKAQFVVRCGSADGGGNPGATEEFRATDVKLYAKPKNYEGACPAQIDFLGEISANGAGTVSYVFLRSDKAKGPVHTLTFDRAGAKPVSTTWTLGGSGLPAYEGWVRLRVFAPNELESRDANFKVSCR